MTLPVEHGKVLTKNDSGMWLTVLTLYGSERGYVLTLYASGTWLSTDTE